MSSKEEPLFQEHTEHLRDGSQRDNAGILKHRTKTICVYTTQSRQGMDVKPVRMIQSNTGCDSTLHQRVLRQHKKNEEVCQMEKQR